MVSCRSPSYNRDFSDSSVSKPRSIFWLTLLLLPSLADGYLVGRLLSLQNVADAHRQLLAATASGDHHALMQPPLVLEFPSPTEREDKGEDEGEDDGGSDREVPISNAKKSLGGYKPMSRFNGSGSRNCFFTPIQCMIQHDVGKYKKLVDSDIRLQLSG